MAGFGQPQPQSGLYFGQPEQSSAAYEAPSYRPGDRVYVYHKNAKYLGNVSSITEGKVNIMFDNKTRGSYWPNDSNLSTAYGNPQTESPWVTASYPTRNHHREQIVDTVRVLLQDIIIH